MLQVHVDILQNLQQALFTLHLPSAAECGIQTDQVVIESQLGNERTVIHFNDLVIDVNKSTEVAPPEIRADAAAQGEIRRTFKFPCLRIPKSVETPAHDLTGLQCARCQAPLKLISEDASSTRSFKIVQQQNINADEVNEVIYCHRFCESHQHEHDKEPPSLAALNLHAEPIVFETTECFVVAKEYAPRSLIDNELVRCPQCSASLGSIGSKSESFPSAVRKDLISFDKAALLPFANDYLSACLRQHEPGRYIIKVAKVNDSVFLVWILPNQILSADASGPQSTQLKFQRKRKLLFTHVTSADDKLFADWKRDFSVTTLLVNRSCLAHLRDAFEHELNRFPNVANPKEAFQSLTISF